MNKSNQTKLKKEEQKVLLAYNSLSTRLVCTGTYIQSSSGKERRQAGNKIVSVVSGKLEMVRKEREGIRRQGKKKE